MNRTYLKASLIKRVDSLNMSRCMHCVACRIENISILLLVMYYFEPNQHRMSNVDRRTLKSISLAHSCETKEYHSHRTEHTISIFENDSIVKLQRNRTYFRNRKQIRI